MSDNDSTGPRPLQRGWGDEPHNAPSSPSGAAVKVNGANSAVKPGPSGPQLDLGQSLPWPADSSPAGLPVWADMAPRGHDEPPSESTTWPASPAPEPVRLVSSPSTPPPAGPPAAHHPASLAFDALVSRRGARPTEGWRGAAFRVTAGRWNPGLSVAEQDRLEKIGLIQTLLPGRHTITVASLKGGIGKTTVSALLGLVLAEYRGDRVIALDANPDAGTLAERLLGQQPIYTVRNLINNLHTIQSTTDISRYTSLAGRLQVLASEQDPAMSEAFNEDEYSRVLAVLKRFYNVVITDSGTGLIHSAMRGALARSNSLVIVGAITADGASRASKTLDWLDKHGHQELVANAVLVLSRDRYSRDNRTAVIEHFQARCREVVELPADPHLATGERIDLGALRPQTRDAAMTLAARVAEQFRTNHDAEPLVRERA